MFRTRGSSLAIFCIFSYRSYGLHIYALDMHEYAQLMHAYFSSVAQLSKFHMPNQSNRPGEESFLFQSEQVIFLLIGSAVSEKSLQNGHRCRQSRAQTGAFGVLLSHLYGRLKAVWWLNPSKICSSTMTKPSRGAPSGPAKLF